MPRRPQISAPAFGKWLQTCRGERSLEWVAGRVRPLVERTGLKVDRSTIKKAELGRVPNWPLLGAFCRVYDVPFMDTVHRLAASLEFPASRELFGPLKRADGDDAARARIRELEDQVQLYEAFLRQARALAAELHNFTAAGLDGVSATPTRRR